MNFLKLLKYKFFNKPLVLKYSDISKYFVQKDEIAENVFPTIIPNWDHTPRSSNKGVVFHDSNPENFQKHLEDVFKVVINKKPSNQIVFLKSWNEWGEGNYMEPDLKFGKKYINTLKTVLDKYI